MPKKVIGGKKLNVERKPRKRERYYKEHDKSYTKTNQDVTDISMRARKAGMSYGKYVSMCYVKGIEP